MLFSWEEQFLSPLSLHCSSLKTHYNQNTSYISGHGDPSQDLVMGWVLREGLEEAVSALKELKFHRSLLSVDGSRSQEKRNIPNPHTATLFCSKVCGSHRIL